MRSIHGHSKKELIELIADKIFELIKTDKISVLTNGNDVIRKKHVLPRKKEENNIRMFSILDT